jgi:apolipoprotein N-acyltransferase
VIVAARHWLRTLPSLGKSAPPAMAVLTGLLYYLAFPGVGLWPLSFVALVPLLATLPGARPWRAAMLGWLAGLVSIAAGHVWLVGTLRRLAEWSLPQALLAVSAFCVFHAGRMALAAWLHACMRAKGWPGEPAFVAAFVTSELLYPAVFPWYFAASLQDQVPLLQIADLCGPITVSVLLCMVNVSVAEGLLALWQHRHPHKVWLAAGPALVALALSYAAWRMPEITRRMESAQAATVAVVQANVSVQEKRTTPLQVVRAHLQLTQAIPESAGVDFVVWGETAMATPEDQERALLTLPLQIGARVSRPLVFGATLSRTNGRQARASLLNSALSTDERGAIQGRYDKHHLVPVGEYLPFEHWWPMLREWLPAAGEFTPGTELSGLPMLGHRVAALLCYEDILPAFARRLVRATRPELLVNLANDVWFDAEPALEAHMALARFRAIEHRRFLVRANNSGISAVVDPLGRLLSRSRPFSREVLIATIRWQDTTTTYQYAGDVIWWVVAFSTLAAAVVGPRWRRREQRRPGRVPGGW